MKVNNNTNIMIISPSLCGGGAEKLAANLSLNLQKDSNVYIVTYLSEINEYKYAGKRINLNCSGDSFFIKSINAIRRIWTVYKLKKQYHIDYSVSFLPQADYVNIISKHKNEKTVIDVVSNMSIVYSSGLRKAFRKFILNKADYIVTVSEGVRQDILKNFGVKNEKSKTIYNSCDIEAIKKVCFEDIEYQKYSNILPPKYIISMGSFRYPKGHWHLIKAFYVIKDQIPDISLVILGEGKYRKQYEKLIKNLDIQNRVYLPGFLNPPYSVIAHSELFVFSSIFEGFGNAVIEAMACQTPILSTDCDYGPREILAPDTDVNMRAQKYEECRYGCLVPPFGDEPINISSEISEKEIIMGHSIKTMLQNQNLCIKYIIAGNEYSKKFDNAIFYKKWMELLRTL